jgi:DNA-binding transcriptional regulator YdaS (Cro superfamily)
MSLKEWAKKNRWHYSEISKEIGYHRIYLNDVANLRRKPSKRLATVISKFTNGEVTVEELLNPNKEESESK